MPMTNVCNGWRTVVKYKRYSNNVDNNKDSRTKFWKIVHLAFVWYATLDGEIYTTQIIVREKYIRSGVVEPFPWDVDRTWSD